MLVPNKRGTRRPPRARKRDRIACNLDRWKQPSRANNLRRILLTGKHTCTGKPRPGFETRRGAERERKLRLRHARAELRRIERESASSDERSMQTSSISLLVATLTAQDASSFANPVFMRELRRRVSGELLRLLRQVPRQQVRFYTIAAPGWRLPADDLALLSPKKLAESLRVNLTRYGRVNQLQGWIASFFHNAYDAATDTYAPHFHLVVVGAKVRAIEALRSLKMFQGGPGSAVYRPIVGKRTNDLVRQTSYLIKSYTPAQAGYIDADGQRRRQRRHHRMPEPRHTELLAFMHHQRFGHLVWLNGLRLQGGRLCRRK